MIQLETSDQSSSLKALMKNIFKTLLIALLCMQGFMLQSRPAWLTKPVGAGMGITAALGLAVCHAYNKMVEAKEEWEINGSAAKKEAYVAARSRFNRLLGAGALAALLTGGYAVMQKKEQKLVLPTEVGFSRGGAPSNRNPGDISLWEAAGQGDLEGLRIALDAGADVDSRTVDGTTPLMAAVLGRNPTGIGYLCEKYAPNAGLQRSSDGSTALMLAVEQRPQEVFGALVRSGLNLNVNAVNNKGQTALDIAAACTTFSNGGLETLVMLGAKRAHELPRRYSTHAGSPDGPDFSIPIHGSDISRETERSKPAEAKKGSNSLPAGGVDATALSFASRGGQAERVRELLDAGGDPNMVSTESLLEPRTLLEDTMNHRVAALLLERGAQVTEAFKANLWEIFRSALQDGNIGARTHAFEVLAQHGCRLDMPLSIGAGPQLTPRSSMLSMLVADDNLDAVRYVLSTKLANVNAKNEDGSTPLDVAMRGFRYKMVACLLECGAQGAQPALHGPEKVKTLLEKTMKDVANRSHILRVFARHNIGLDALVVQDFDDRSVWITLLSEAAEEGNVDRVCELCEWGAEASVRNSDGSTMLMRAIGAEQRSFAKWALYGIKGHCLSCPAQRNDGMTALMLALKSGDEMADDLLKRAYERDGQGLEPIDLNINACNERGQTALDIALEARRGEIIINKLRAAGAKTVAELESGRIPAAR